MQFAAAQESANGNKSVRLRKKVACAGPPPSVKLNWAARMPLGEQEGGMRRRDLLRLAVGAAAGWPISTQGQQQGTLKHVGVLLGLARGPDDTGAGEILRPLMASMREMGWAE